MPESLPQKPPKSPKKQGMCCDLLAALLFLQSSIEQSELRPGLFRNLYLRCSLVVITIAAHAPFFCQNGRFFAGRQRNAGRQHSSTENHVIASTCTLVQLPRSRINGQRPLTPEAHPRAPSQTPNPLVLLIMEKQSGLETSASSPLSFVEPTTGLEPVTCALRVRCSTN